MVIGNNIMTNIILKDNEIIKSLLPLSKETIVSVLKSIKTIYGLNIDDQIEKIPKQKLLYTINECISFSVVDELLCLTQEYDNINHQNHLQENGNITDQQQQQQKDETKFSPIRSSKDIYSLIIEIMGNHSQLINHPYFIDYNVHSNTKYIKTADSQMIIDQIVSSNHKISFFQLLSSQIKHKGINYLLNNSSEYLLRSIKSCLDLHYTTNSIISPSQMLTTTTTTNNPPEQTKNNDYLKEEVNESRNDIIMNGDDNSNGEHNHHSSNNNNNNNNNNNDINHNSASSKDILIDEMKIELTHIGTESFLNNLTSPPLKMIAENLRLNKCGSKDFIIDQIMHYLFRVTYDKIGKRSKTGQKKKRKKQNLLLGPPKVNQNYNKIASGSGDENYNNDNNDYDMTMSYQYYEDQDHVNDDEYDDEEDEEDDDEDGEYDDGEEYDEQSEHKEKEQEEKEKEMEEKEEDGNNEEDSITNIPQNQNKRKLPNVYKFLNNNNNNSNNNNESLEKDNIEESIQNKKIKQKQKKDEVEEDEDEESDEVEEDDDQQNHNESVMSAQILLIKKGLTKEQLYGLFHAKVLKYYCRQHELKASGTKTMIIKRIMSYLERNSNNSNTTISTSILPKKNTVTKSKKKRKKF